MTIKKFGEKSKFWPRNLKLFIKNRQLSEIRNCMFQNHVTSDKTVTYGTVFFSLAGSDIYSGRLFQLSYFDEDFQELRNEIIVEPNRISAHQQNSKLPFINFACFWKLFRIFFCFETFRKEMVFRNFFGNLCCLETFRKKTVFLLETFR